MTTASIPIELILSSTSSSPASPLTTTLLHSVQTGAQLFSFKSPNASSSSSSASTSTSGKQDLQQAGSSLALSDRKSFGYAAASNGVGGYLIGLGGKDGRSGVNVWSFHKEQVVQRLIPPVRLTTIAVAHSGLYLAGGTLDGRIFLWETSSGSLLLTIDAHYRAISVLEFSSDDAALVSGSEDSGVSIWAMGRLLSASLRNPPTPFATLSDHTLPITSIAIGLGSFPKCRIMTASLDSTVKIWDISTCPSILLATFSFPSPIELLAWDPFERYFFASGPNPASPSNSTKYRVVKVPLYETPPTNPDGFASVVEALVGNDEHGRVQTAVEKNVYSISDRITAVSLSSLSPTLLVGTSTSQIHLLSLPSLLAIRIILPPPSTAPPSPITYLSTLLRPSNLGSNTSNSSNPNEGARTLFVHGLGRSMVLSAVGGTGGEDYLKGGNQGRVVEMRVPLARDVSWIIRIPCGLTRSSRNERTMSVVQGKMTGGTMGVDGGSEALVKVQELEDQIAKLKMQLGKAVSLNQGMWDKVVQGSLGAERWRGV
ncbi:BQ2448_6940 [Microbotryum intermedium]|uniref:Pre-rRNA-processing protein IPI3 n=1 Tax=Microbotryum intermedium TaxID=269621 RepID=A0A238FIM8_9BASI|nr:BQ2448_6940 [Microbotryum intermedium]